MLYDGQRDQQEAEEILHHEQQTGPPRPRPVRASLT